MLGLRCCMDFFLVAVRGATLYLWCAGFSLQWLLSLQRTGSRARGLQQLWLLSARTQAQ